MTSERIIVILIVAAAVLMLIRGFRSKDKKDGCDRDDCGNCPGCR